MKRPITLSLLLALAPAALGARDGVRNYLKNDDAWFASDQARAIAANVLSWQSELGGWPKNVDTTTPCRVKNARPTFDNGATTGELRFLARAFAASGDAACRAAVERGIDYVLKAQYPSGGWPQFHPPDQAYHRFITFNDDAMARVMELCREAAASPRFAFLDEGRKHAARAAFDRGIACILKCQIRVNGKLTAWCAQHDEVTFEPRPGRTFEPMSLSGEETVGIVRLLMSVEKPDDHVVRAVDAAVDWLRAARIKGIRVESVPDANSPKGTDRRVIADPAAAGLWARFYEIGTNRPIFCDRDKAVKYDLAQIGYERRNGYAWYGNWGESLLKKEYPAWKKSKVKSWEEQVKCQKSKVKSQKLRFIFDLALRKSLRSSRWSDSD